MASSVSLPRTLLIYALAIPLALMLGYLLTTPLDAPSFFAVLLACFVLSIPILMRYHHALLVASWNAFICIFFLPGQPYLWMLLAVLSLAFTVVNRVLAREKIVLHIPAVTYSLLFLAGVVALTAKITGGIGVRSLGSSTYGGKGYFYILLAIVGYFALSSTPIPPHRVSFYVKLYFLTGVTAVLGHLVLLGGPGFYWLFNLFPVSFAISQARAEFTGSELVRLTGVTMASMAVFCYMLARYGIKGIFSTHHPLRFLILMLAITLTTFGGFRSAVGWLFIIFVVEFLFEGLLRTKLAPIVAGLMLLALALLFPLASHLPVTVQRAISFLPVQVDPIAKFDAQASTEWRLEMWRMMLPQLPKYMVLGKGYVIDPTDMYLTLESTRRGFAHPYENAIVAGDYHNGALSVYVPFGSFGVLAFLLFLFTGTRLLYRNFRYGSPELKQINTFLISYFIARIVVFFFVFGSLSTDLFHFTGLVGLSIALNGGEHKATDMSPTPQLAPVGA